MNRMKHRTIRGKLATLFIGFFLLVAVSAGVTYWASSTQEADAVVINLAGRQRMLSQQMTWLALNAPESTELTDAIHRFDVTLQALREGGEVMDPSLKSVTLPPAPDSYLDDQLTQVFETWESFRGKIEILRSPIVAEATRAETASALQKESPLILAQLDAIVTEFEERAEAKVTRFKWIETVFLLLAFIFLIAGYSVARQRIMYPLVDLEASTRKISQGDFSQPIRSDHVDEFGKLAGIFEHMRKELQTARESLEDRVERRTQELSEAFEFSQEIVAQLDLDHLLQSVVERTQTLMQADSVALCLLKSDQATLELAAYRGERVDLNGMKHSARRGFAVQVFDTGQVQAGENTCSGCGFLHAQGQGHCLAAPLKVGDQYLGALCLARKGERAFDEDEKRALTLLVNAAAIAITNANLASSERREARQVAVLAERERLAAELHDHLAQTLSFLRIKTGRVEKAITGSEYGAAAEELKRIQSALETAYDQVREALTGLKRPIPDGDDLAQKLADCKAEFEKLSDLPLELIIQHREALEIQGNLQVQIVHIVQGALSNIYRHAQANQVKVSVSRQNGMAQFIVEDDGIGFDSSSNLDDDHLGLNIMRTRAERSGGQFAVEATPGKGTRVIVCFPLLNKSDETIHHITG